MQSNLRWDVAIYVVRVAVFMLVMAFAFDQFGWLDGDAPDLLIAWK